MGNTCKPLAVSFQCMTKSTTNKKNKIKLKKIKKRSPGSECWSFPCVFPLKKKLLFESPLGSPVITLILFTKNGLCMNKGFFFLRKKGHSSQSDPPTSRTTMLGLPWWFHGLESICQGRGYRSDPWSQKIPNAVGQLSPCITATEARVPRAHALLQEKPPQ